MSYDTMVEKIKTVPQECLADIENYIQFVLYRYNQNSKTENKSIQLIIYTLIAVNNVLFLRFLNKM